MDFKSTKHLLHDRREIHVTDVFAHHATQKGSRASFARAGSSFSSTKTTNRMGQFHQCCRSPFERETCNELRDIGTDQPMSLRDWSIGD